MYHTPIKENKCILIISILALLLLLCIACQDGIDLVKSDNGQKSPDSVDPFVQNDLLGRGINLGNMLEAPNEGDWGLTVEEEYFQLIKAAGFNSVRIPIRWSAHTTSAAPYMIDIYFISRVDQVVRQALAHELAVVINVHHYQEIMSDPAGEKDRFLAIWSQLSAHYASQSDSVIFEILNEPHGDFTAELWNEYLQDAIDIIRQDNPNRTLMVGTANWGGLSSLDDLIIPEGDHNIIFTFHYYDPFHFTHQGAEWVENSSEWLGTTWDGTMDENFAIVSDFNQVRAWGIENNRPIYLGEFGAYNRADMASRAAWTSFIARQAEAMGFSWGYWEFASGFGIYDPATGQWRQDLVEALIPPAD